MSKAWSWESARQNSLPNVCDSAQIPPQNQEKNPSRESGYDSIFTWYLLFTTTWSNQHIASASLSYVLSWTKLTGLFVKNNKPAKGFLTFLDELVTITALDSSGIIQK